MEKKEYLVSLITPVYNAIEYIGKAFESVKKQTIGFENIEWLMIDDGSTDGTFELISSWAQKYPNIVVLQTPSNTGTPAGPRNVGLDNATAPYVMFLDNDDAFFPNAMKVLYDEAELTGADIVTGDVRLMNKRRFSHREQAQLLNYTDGVELGLHQMSHPVGDWIVPYLNNHWSKIYRREIIEANRIRCLSGELWEDILFLFQYMTCVKTMSHVDAPIVDYRVRRESLSHVLNKRFFCSLPKSIDYGMDHMKSLGDEHAYDYVELLTRGGHVEYYIDLLMDTEHLSREELTECLLAWKNPLVYSPVYGAVFHSAYCKILADDFACGEDDKAIFHFFTLKELYKQRQLEMNNIFNSTTYKLAKKLSDAKGMLVKGEME